MELDVCSWEGSTWNGMVLADETHVLLAKHVGVTWVAGLRHGVDAAQGPSLPPGHQLELFPEPENPVDVHAVGVWRAEGSTRIGYIPHTYAVKLTPAHRYGLSLVEQIEEGERTGLLIAVSREPIDARHVTLEPKLLERRLAHLPKVQLPRAEEVADPLEEMWEIWRASHPAEAVP